MNNKKLILLFTLFVIGSLVGVWFLGSQKQRGANLQTSVSENISGQEKSNPTTVIQPSPTKVIPTLPPLSRTITKISSEKIIVYDKQLGEMQIPNDPSKVKVVRRSAGSLIPASISDLKEGQAVTVNIVPRVSVEIIIEQ